jgi:hypothetical protein
MAIASKATLAAKTVIRFSRRLAVLLSVTLVAGALSGCGDADIDESVVRVVVDIPGGYQWGSGFVVAPGGHVVTNHHVVDTKERIHRPIFVYREGNKERRYKAYFRWSSPELDLALLEVPELDSPALPINDGELEKEDAVRAVGFPGGSNAVDEHKDAVTISTRTGGQVSRTFKADWKNFGRHVGVVQHTAAINHGSSGGPLINACGEVVGVNTLIAAAQLETRGQQLLGVDVIHSTFFASHASELSTVLRVRGVPADIRSQRCGAGVLSASTGTIAVAASSAIALALMTWFLLTPRFAGVGPDWLRPRSIKGFGSAGTTTRVHKPVAHWTIRGQLPEGGGEVNLSIDESGIGKAGAIILGRDPAVCDLIIPHPTVSSRGHAKFYRDGNDLMIMDLRSTNGTIADGIKLGGPGAPEAVRLRNGMRLSFGAVNLSVVRT